MRKTETWLVLTLLIATLAFAMQTFPVESQETLIWQADVPSTGEPVISPVLEAGREYRIEVQNWFISTHPIGGWVTYAADAQYYTAEFNGTFIYGPTWTTPLPAPDGHSFLQIDGMDVNWGPFNNTMHMYTTYYTGTGTAINFTIVDWIDGTPYRNFCHLIVKIYEGPPPPPEAETAFAYGGDYATCFLSMGFRSWGWTNGPLGPGSYKFEIWAGAAQCDLSKGTLVGNLTIDYDGSTATVTYTMDAGWKMTNTQLYVGSDPLPIDKKGDYTVAPGQYPYQHTGIDATSDTYTEVGLSGDIYVVAHADVVET